MPANGFPAAGATVVVGEAPDLVLVTRVVVDFDAVVVLSVVDGTGAGAEPGKHCE